MASQQQSAPVEDDCDNGLYTPSGYCKIIRDPFINARLVAGLDSDTFKPYLKDKELVMVMFYDPCDPASQEGKLLVAKSSENPNRHGQLYAAVNCQENQDLCREEKVKKYPEYKLYVNGNTQDFLRDPLQFTKYSKIYLSL